ncbi:hypothetical protein Q3G72_017608 [Acer saccharum]|nr:hypothetical protein Q3G72_017608 [Acer saccharum]
MANVQQQQVNESWGSGSNCISAINIDGTTPSPNNKTFDDPNHQWKQTYKQELIMDLSDLDSVRVEYTVQHPSMGRSSPHRLEHSAASWPAEIWGEEAGNVDSSAGICNGWYYSAVNEIDKAVEMMRRMQNMNHGVPTSSSYTPIIHALCEAGRVLEAKNFLIELVDGGSVPREYTYKLVCDALDAAGESSLLDDELHRRIRNGIANRFRQVAQPNSSFFGIQISYFGLIKMFSVPLAILEYES